MDDAVVVLVAGQLLLTFVDPLHAELLIFRAHTRNKWQESNLYTTTTETVPSIYETYNTLRITEQLQIRSLTICCCLENYFSVQINLPVLNNLYALNDLGARSGRDTLGQSHTRCIKNTLGQKHTRSITHLVNHTLG